MESVRRSTRKRKCIDYNYNCDDDNLNYPDRGSPSRISAQKTPRNGENVAPPELSQTRKKKKLSLGKKSGVSNKDNKEKELGEKYEGVQEVNMVVVVDPIPANVSIEGDAKDLFDDDELSDPPKDLDEDLESEVVNNPNLKNLKDKQTKMAAKNNDTYAFDYTDDESDYDGSDCDGSDYEECKSKSKKKSSNTGRKAKSATAKENGEVKKGKGKKQIVSTNTSELSSLQTKKVPGGLKKKAIGESNTLMPKFISGKIPSSGLSRKLKVKSLHPYLKKQ